MVFIGMWYNDNFGICNSSEIVLQSDKANKRVSQLRAPLAAPLEPTSAQNRQPNGLYVFEHKT